MAESPIEKLKRLAREKKEKAASAQPVIGTPEFVELVTENSEANLEMRFALALEKIKNEPASTALETIQVKDGETGARTEVRTLGNGVPEECIDKRSEETVQLEDASLNSSTGELTPTPSNHPLAMEFAELEAMMLSADPQFRFQLRNVHRHLGKEPELVTMMTEEEIQRVVRGLVELANSEIVEPAKAKSVKKATAELKKKVISADDL